MLQDKQRRKITCSFASRPLSWVFLAALLLLPSACSTRLASVSDMARSEESIPNEPNLNEPNPNELNLNEPALSEQVLAQSSPVDYLTYDLPQATVHVVRLDPQSVSLSVVAVDGLETVDAIARSNNAIAAINAGFFDPQNGKTTSYLSSQGELVGDPTENERLMDNPDLQSYLPDILNRSEFRRYFCQPTDKEPVAEGEGVIKYDITFHDAPIPNGCLLDDAVGAGPQLLPEDTSTAEAFTHYENGELVRDAIGSVSPNARSAVGTIGNTEEIVFIMAAQREDAAGFTLTDMADFATTTLGVDALLNLDGGSSSTLYYDGQIHTARVDAEGNPIERPVKSVILVK